MAKDPAFLFYPNDYIGGTMGMTFEEKGAYIELLMLQFNRGHMTKHMMAQTVGQLLDKLLDKFVLDENGLYYNIRLQEEQEKRKAFTASRRNNKKGNNQHTKNKSENLGHMTSHMENENININIDNNIDYNKFLEWFNTTRTKYLEIPSHVNRLTQTDKSNLEILKKSYSNEEFNIALLNICNDKWANESNLILPSHFLKEENFVKYLNMPQRPLLTKRQKQIAGWGI